MCGTAMKRNWRHKKLSQYRERKRISQSKVSVLLETINLKKSYYELEIIPFSLLKIHYRRIIVLLASLSVCPPNNKFSVLDFYWFILHNIFHLQQKFKNNFQGLSNLEKSNLLKSNKK